MKRIAQDEAEARIWCAFQHYGQFDARLIARPRGPGRASAES
jgi:hypothetical protein